MNTEKPKDICEYKEWLSKYHKAEVVERTKTYYASVANKVKMDFEKSGFWIELNDNLKEFDSEYYSHKGLHLLIETNKPQLYVKPFDSFLLKTFRKNILENVYWPNEPKGGWIPPNSWYSRINDIIRTLFVVKYLDGVEFMIDRIHKLCMQHTLTCEPFLEAREEGYYAAHIYTKKIFEIPRINWDTEKVEFSIEIQITTQLQEVIRQLLHKYYEERRKRAREEDTKWQWNYKSDEFVTNYLGHILHYVEGMIMEVRERQEKEEIT